MAASTIHPSAFPSQSGHTKVALYARVSTHNGQDPSMQTRELEEESREGVGSEASFASVKLERLGPQRIIDGDAARLTGPSLSKQAFNVGRGGGRGPPGRAPLNEAESSFPRDEPLLRAGLSDALGTTDVERSAFGASD